MLCAGIYHQNFTRKHAWGTPAPWCASPLFFWSYYNYPCRSSQLDQKDKSICLSHFIDPLDLFWRSARLSIIYKSFLTVWKPLWVPRDQLITSSLQADFVKVIAACLWEFPVANFRVFRNALPSEGTRHVFSRCTSNKSPVYPERASRR